MTTTVEPRVKVGQATPGLVLNIISSGPTKPKPVTREMREKFKQSLESRAESKKPKK